MDCHGLSIFIILDDPFMDDLAEDLPTMLTFQFYVDKHRVYNFTMWEAGKLRE